MLKTTRKQKLNNITIKAVSIKAYIHEKTNINAEKKKKSTDSATQSDNLGAMTL